MIIITIIIILAETSSFLENDMVVFVAAIILFVVTVIVVIISHHQRSKGGSVLRTLISHQCGLGSNPGSGAICGLSLLLFLTLAPRGFSLGTPVLLSPQKPTVSKFQFDQEG